LQRNRLAPRPGNRLQVLIKLELLWVGPDIRRILGHVDGKVAQDLYAQVMRLGTQSAPLLKEEELDAAPQLDPCLQPLLRPRERPRVAATQLIWPLRPCSAVRLALERHKEGVVIQPPCLLLAKRG